MVASGKGLPEWLPAVIEDPTKKTLTGAPDGRVLKPHPAAKSLLRRYKKGSLRWRKEGSGRRITDSRGRNIGALEKPQTSIAPALRAELATRYQTGATIRELAEWSGAHRETVVRHLVHAGTELRRGGLTAEQAQTARELYAEGFTLVEIAARLGVGASTVRRGLLRLGVILRPAGRRRLQRLA